MVVHARWGYDAGEFSVRMILDDDRGKEILEKIMSGKNMRILFKGGTVGASLEGSRAAIETANKACGN